MHHGGAQDGVYFAANLNSKDAKSIIKFVVLHLNTLGFGQAWHADFLCINLGRIFIAFGCSVSSPLQNKSHWCFDIQSRFSDIFVVDLCSLQSFTSSPRCCHILSLPHRHLKSKLVH